MVKVLFIGKYPPIEGGTATAAYWRNKELQKYNFIFEVVTSIPEDNEYKIEYSETDKHVHLLCEKTPWHIPYSQLFSEKLISKALEVANINKIDVVEGNYLFPYGFAAYVVSKVINRPLILRHAGSDLYRISTNSMFVTLLKEMASQAKIVVTNDESKEMWKNMCEKARIVISSRYVPDPKYFCIAGKHEDVVFMSKVTEKWDKFQLKYYYDFLRRNNYVGNIKVFSNQYSIKVFREFFNSKGYEILENSFVMPDMVPHILSNTKYLLLSQIPFGINEESNIYKEGIVAGCIPVCMENIVHSKLDFDYFSYIKMQRVIYEEAIR